MNMYIKAASLYYILLTSTAVFQAHYVTGSFALFMASIVAAWNERSLCLRQHCRQMARF